MPCSSEPGPVAPPTTGTISGQDITVQRDGDFYMPRLSPDGRTLAFVKVIPMFTGRRSDGVIRPGPTVEVLVLNLATGVRRQALTSGVAARHSYYGASVNDMRWRGASTLEVDIHDGDVAVSRVVVRVPSRRVLEARRRDSDARPLSSHERSAREAIVDAFPHINERLADEVRQGTGVLMPNGGVLVQEWPPYAEPILFGPASPSGRLLSDVRGYLMGGVAVARGAIFLMNANAPGPATQWDLWIYRDEAVELAASGVTPSLLGMWLRDIRGCGVVAMVGNPLAFTAPRENPMFFFDGRRVVQLVDVGRSHDVDIAGHIVAFSHWVGDQRRITVRKLLLARSGATRGQCVRLARGSMRLLGEGAQRESWVMNVDRGMPPGRTVVSEVRSICGSGWLFSVPESTRYPIRVALRDALGIVYGGTHSTFEGLEFEDVMAPPASKAEVATFLASRDAERILGHRAIVALRRVVSAREAFYASATIPWASHKELLTRPVARRYFEAQRAAEAHLRARVTMLKTPSGVDCD